MKGSAVVAAVAALAGGASAHRAHRHAQAHELFEKRGANDTAAVCVPQCTTYYTTIYGEPTLVQPTPTTAPAPTTTPKTTAPVTVPTPIQQTCPTPGTYTFPATTVVLTETTTVCGATTTTVPKGTHTLGGVTTVVTTATTVTCPVATTETLPGGDVTSVIKTTTYVCPTAGTYTIGPVTSTVTVEETVCVVPTVTSYAPGTYTAPAVVTTVTETNVVVVCPFTSPAPEPTEAPAPTSEAPAPTAEVPAPTAEVPAPSSTPSSTPAPPLGGGDQWAMTYTPYSSEGLCKSRDEVMSDVQAIKNAGFSTLRVYSTDCDTLPNVGDACRTYGLKMIIGVFVGAAGCDNTHPTVADQISAIKEWAQWDLVASCIVGNEALFNGYCTPGQLKSLIEEVRGVLTAGGCTAPITTTDTTNGWQMDGVAETICGAVDVVALNSHAYFNGYVQPENAGTFVQSQLQIVRDLCGGKEGYIAESGWPTAGNCIAEACPGVSQQAAAIKSLKEVIGSNTVFFSWGNDPWKKPGDCNCEQSWGCGQLFN